MGIRVNRLLSEVNIGIATLDGVLKAMGYKELNLTINSIISDEMANIVRGLCSQDTDLLTLIEIAGEKRDYSNSKKIIDSINTPHPLKYSEKQSFWISELAILSPAGKVNIINVGSFKEANSLPLYSVLIGTNGAGKSMLMKEIVDFFIDLRACANGTDQRIPSASKGRLKGIRYHIDGLECEVIRLEKSYLAKIDGYIRALNDLRLPSIVACHFGAFDKLPTQKVNGSAQTRYDVPYYKYVGAHVNGSMISSSAIAFRLLFALNEQMDKRQRQNICSILDFIGYDHRISLSYSLVMKSKRNGEARDDIAKRVEKDREYSGLNKQERNRIVTQLYNFYKSKTSSDKAQYNYEIDFDTAYERSDELQNIYKLKQCDLVNSTNVIFHKKGSDVTSDDMSSGEFDMLSTVLSISAAANDPHTLVLLDEPELSLHPNWQMTLIDNLDRALKDQICHLVIATHSHMLVSDLPMKRSAVTQIEKDEKGEVKTAIISESTYGWSAEEVLLKVFKTATDRNRYFGERIGKLLEKMGNNTIKHEDVTKELKELQEISMHLSDIDPMKTVLKTIVETYK